MVLGESHVHSLEIRPWLPPVGHSEETLGRIPILIPIPFPIPIHIIVPRIRIAETAYTSTRKDLTRVLTEATEALLRHPHYCISGYSSVAYKESVKEAQKCFNQISSEERAKFDEDTLVNLNNVKRRIRSSTERPTVLQNEFIVVTVVTVLVAVKGRHQFPTINDSSDFNKALQNLGSIPSRDLLAMRVLWTPQQENDALSEQELLKDYPLLRRF